MRPAGPPRRDQGDDAMMFRRRPVPTRVLADVLIVARPSDGAPVVLAPTAAFVWRLLDGWTSTAEIDRRLTQEFVEVTAEDRVDTRAEILTTLQDEGLVERG